MAMTAFELVGLLTLNSQSFDKGLNAAQTAAGSFRAKVANGFATVAKIGTAALATATTGAVAFAKSAVGAGSAFDSAMGGVAATMGSSVEEMEQNIGEVDTAYGHFSGTLRDFAIFMGQNTTFSATQAAGALNYMALAGYDAQESMQMLPSVLSMAAAGSMDLALASDMITDTQSALGLSFERTSQMVNEFAKAAATGNTNVEQLGEAFLRVGGLARELNSGMITLSDGTLAEVDGVQELEIAFTAMANAGIKGGEAGTHMRNMLLKLSNPTEDGAKALEAMGVAVFDAAGNMQPLSKIFEGLSAAMGKMTQAEKLTVIGDLFNARDTASAEALLSAVTSGWDEIGESILAADGAADQMSKTKLNNLTGDITLFRSALEAAQITLNDKLSPTLREFVQFGANSVQKLTSSFQEGGLDGAMTALGEVLAEGLNIVIEKIPMFVDAGAKLLSALGKGLFDNLDTIIDGGVTIIEKIGEVIIAAAPKLIDAGLRLLEALLNTLDSNFDGIMTMLINFVSEIAKTLANHAPVIISALMSIGSKLVDYAIQNLPTFIKLVTDIIKKVVAEFGNHQKEFLSGAVSIISALAKGMVENLPTIIETAITVLQIFLQAMTEDISIFVDAGLMIIQALVQALTDNLPTILNAGILIITQLISAITNNLPFVIEMALTIIQTIVNALASNLPLLLNSAIQIVVALVNGIVDNIPMLIDGVIALINGIYTFVLQNSQIILEAGLQIVMALINGLIEALPELIAFMPDLILTMVNTLIENMPMMFDMGIQILEALIDGLASLILEMFELGGEIIEKLITGLINNFSKIGETAVKMWNTISDTFSEKLEAAKNWGKDLVDNFVSGIQAKWEKLKSSMTDVGNMIKDFLGFSEPKKGPLSNFHTYAPDMMDLFMKGIEDNENALQATVGKAFDFEDLINSPTMKKVDVDGVSGGAARGGNNFTINVNQPVSTPADMLREIRTEAQYGLMIGESLA